LVKAKNIRPIPEFSLRTNIWKYSVSFNDKTGHPAVFPEKLAEDHILSWSNEGDLVLDPFMGSGTTLIEAQRMGRNSIGIELQDNIAEEAEERIKSENKPDINSIIITIKELKKIKK
jgi:site-specific DNA-methyltransferase (adenine-specific)